MVKVNYTERTWGIDLVSAINDWSSLRVGSAISRASGEVGVGSDSSKRTLFPDVCLFSDEDRVVMGWELKLPNTAISDQEFFENAVEKADRLGTNSFLLWNVNHAVLFGREFDRWEPLRSWSIGKPLKRDEVEGAWSRWTAMLGQILTEIESLHANRIVRDAKVSVSLGKPTYSLILEQCAPGQTALIRERCAKDRILHAQISEWFNESIAKVKGQADLYQSLAEAQIVNWINKLLFCHYLKQTSEDAYEVDTFGPEHDASTLLGIFANVSASSDFRSVFQPLPGQEFATRSLLDALLELNRFLIGFTSNVGGEFRLDESLAAGLSYFRGKLSGQFATPVALSKLLVAIAVKDVTGQIYDPCCGSGTIIKAAADMKRRYGLSENQVAAEIWASDKFNIPTSLTGVALANPLAIGLAQQVFQADVATLRVGRTMSFTDPSTGRLVRRELPSFDTILSNLPFVRFEDLSSTQSKDNLRTFANVSPSELSGKADLYAYIALGLETLMSRGGRAGLVLSNSWLATAWGAQFLDQLKKRFSVDFLVTSGRGRWFDNAEVVATLIVLSEPKQNARTSVVSVNRRIEEWTDDWIDRTAIALLAGKEPPETALATVPQDFLGNDGIYAPNLAHVGSFADELSAQCALVSDFFSIARGSRPGAEKYFFLATEDAEKSGIEQEYLRPLLHRPGKAMANLELGARVDPNYFLVQIERSEADLLELGHTGALNWIKNFSFGSNNTGDPYPKVFAKAKPYWYTPRVAPETNFVMQMNPEKVLAVYLPKGDQAAVSQRFITLQNRTDHDRELLHALLNSSVAYLWQELIAFPKGLGALDRNPSRMKRYLKFPNPNRINEDGRAKLLRAFEPLLSRVPKPLDEELRMDDRREFDQCVAEATGITVDMDKVWSGLEQVYLARLSVRM